MLKIGNIQFNNIAFLAPMAGMTDRAFRELCASYGAPYAVTEMVSAKALTMGDKKSRELLKFGEGENIKGVQIFGSEPYVMGEAAKIVETLGADIIDINMGCPAPKITSSGAGSALMKNPLLCGEIVRAVKSSVSVPVTVKIRSGWDEGSQNAAEIAKICEKSGADAITVHGRTRQQMYSGKADLNIIKRVKSSVLIPVIGNGDIKGPQSAAIMLSKTNCDAVMIGRGALGRPWVFQQINAYLNECRVIPDPPLEKRLAVMLRQVQKMIDYKGEYTAMREARHHAMYYTKGVRGGAKFRREMSKIEHPRDLALICAEIIKENAK